MAVRTAICFVPGFEITLLILRFLQQPPSIEMVHRKYRLHPRATLSYFALSSEGPTSTAMRCEVSPSRRSLTPIVANFSDDSSHPVDPGHNQSSKTSSMSISGQLKNCPSSVVSSNFNSRVAESTLPFPWEEGNRVLFLTVRVKAQPVKTPQTLT